MNLQERQNMKSKYNGKINLILILSIGILSFLLRGSAIAQKPFNKDSTLKEIRLFKVTNPDTALILINQRLEEATKIDWYIAIAELRHFKSETLMNLGLMKDAQNHSLENRALTNKWINLLEGQEKETMKSLHAYTFLTEGNYFLRTGKYDSSIWSCQRAIQLFKDLDREQRKIDQGVSTTNITLSAAYYYLGNVDTALVVMKNNQHVLERIDDIQNVVIGYSNIGTIYRQTGDLHNSLRAFQKALPIAREKKYSVLGGILTGIGQIYYELGEYEKALRFGLESIEFAKTVNNKFQIGWGSCDVGDNYKNLNNPDSSQYYYEQALQIHKDIENHIDVAYTLQRMASLKIDQEQYDEALKLIAEGLNLESIDDYIEEKSRLLGNKAEALFLQKKYVEAQDVINLLMSDLEQIDNNTVKKDAYKIAHRVFHVNGDNSNAYKYLQKYVAFQDTVFKEEKTLEIARLEFKFQLKEETDKLEQAKQLQAKQFEAELEKEKLIQQWGLVVFSLIMIILLITYRNFRVTKNKNIELSHKNEMIASKNDQLKFKNDEITSLREKEKGLADEALALKERELTTTTLLSFEKNNLLERLEDQLGKLTDKVDQKVLPDLREIKRTIKSNLNEESWATFTYHFENVHPHFFENVKARYDDLTLNDLKLCAYIKVGLENKVIATMSNITVAGVKKSINRLKKKINLGPGEDLRNLLMSI